jgi:hypothetical protein
MTISNTSERVWWKEPLERTELVWIAIALVWCLIMFFMMPYWHVYGKQNLANEAYRTTPEMFTAKTQAMVDKYKVREETDQKVPVVGWQLGLPVYGTYPNYFGFQNANTKNIQSEFTSRNSDVIKALGGTKLAIVGSNASNSVIFTEQVKSAANKTKGLKTVYLNHDIPVGTTEFGAVVDQIKQSGADSMYTALDNNGNTGLMAGLKQAGVTLDPVVFPGGYSPLVLGLPTYDNVYFGIEFKPYEITPEWPGLTEYKKWMASESPNAPLSQITGVGWLSVNTLIEGIKAAGVNCPTRKAFINNLRLVKGYTADGFFDDPETTIDFAEVFGKPFQCVYYVHVENKQFVPQFEGKPFCAKQLITDNKITKVVPTTTTVAPTATTAAP